MKVLLVNTYDTGGAARACIRLHQGLLKQGIESKLLLLRKTDHSLPSTYQFDLLPGRPFERTIFALLKKHHVRIPFKNRYDRSAFVRNRPEGYEIFSFPETIFDITHHSAYEEADLVNLHWVADFIDYPSFFRQNSKPVVWTLHDMNPFTGGCHYSGSCAQFMGSCSECPQMKGTLEPRYAQINLKSKLKSVRGNQNVSIVTPSRWLGEASKNSLLFNPFQHFHIPYGIDTNVFQPRDRESARELLGIGLERRVILFVADFIITKRKGYTILREALETLRSRDSVTLCAVGNNDEQSTEDGRLLNLGRINNERFMSLIYSAADAFVIPSLEDNLPNTVIESLLCGTPVIGFPVGGIKDAIVHGENGLLCQNTSSGSLVIAIEELLSGQHRFDRERIRRDAAGLYAEEIQAREYMSLYGTILSARKTQR